MKIALVFPGCHRRGGVERVVFECARFLSGRGHDVTVFANEWDEVPAEEVRMVKVRMPKAPAFLRGPLFFRSSSAALQREKFDVVNTHGCVCPVGGVYWAQSVHAAWLSEAKKFRPLASLARWKQILNPAHPVLLALERRHLMQRRYQRVIALSSKVADDLTRYYGVPSEDVEIVPVGFSESEFNLGNVTAQRRELRERLGYQASDRVVVFVANEAERKGLRPLMRAIAALNDLDVHLLVVGMSAFDEHAGLGKRLKLVGRTGSVADYYAAADLFALPTQYEAWGLVIVEALACGLPVLTSRLAGAAVAVQEGATGLLLDDPSDVQEIADKLRTLLAGGRLPPKEISRTVQHLTWSEVLRRYEAVLEKASAAALKPKVASPGLVGSGTSD